MGKYSCKVLSYHRVLPAGLVGEQATQKSLMVTIESFRRQLLHVRKRYHILRIDELARALTAGAGFRRPSCMITFDDGWRDNYLYAFPVLKELAIPATIFVAVNHIETGEDFWPERLTRLLLSAEPTEANRQTVERSLGVPFPAQSEANRLEASNLAIIKLKGNPLGAIEAAISGLEGALASRRNHIRTARSMCYWHELEEMLRSRLITIGSHSLSHAILTNEDKQRQLKEIIESKKILEERMGAPVPHFAYPNGNFDLAIEKMVKEAGYRSACTCLNGINNCATSPYRIRRIHIVDHNAYGADGFSQFRFSLRISDAFQQMKRVRNSLSRQAY